MEPGDFILWDSRAAHYGAAPLGKNKRMAICEISQLESSKLYSKYTNMAQIFRHMLQTYRVLNRRATRAKGGGFQARLHDGMPPSLEN